MIILSIGIEILHMDGLDFKEEQIYSVYYEMCAMFMKHKKNYKKHLQRIQRFVFSEH